jgi:hypothetical protein
MWVLAILTFSLEKKLAWVREQLVSMEMMIMDMQSRPPGPKGSADPWGLRACWVYELITIHRMRPELLRHACHHTLTRRRRVILRMMDEARARTPVPHPCLHWLCSHLPLSTVVTLPSQVGSVVRITSDEYIKASPDLPLPNPHVNPSQGDEQPHPAAGFRSPEFREPSLPQKEAREPFRAWFRRIHRKRVVQASDSRPVEDRWPHCWS